MSIDIKKLKTGKLSILDPKILTACAAMTPAEYDLFRDKLKKEGIKRLRDLDIQVKKLKRELSQPPKPEPLAFDEQRHVMEDRIDENEMVTRTEDKLLEGSAPIYRQGQRLVHPFTIDEPPGEKDAVRFEVGSLILNDMTDDRMRLFIGEYCDFVRDTAKGLVRVPVPDNLARLCIGRPDRWRYRPLVGIVETPTLRRDGTVMSQPGYDAASGLLGYFNSKDFPAIPELPTYADALDALAKLEEPLNEFPFVDGVSRSIAVSNILTPMVRRTMTRAPGHGFDAPAPGTGKTKLANIGAIVATGRSSAAMNWASSDEENEKRLAGVLMKGAAQVNIDNATTPIQGSMLCTMLTDSAVQIRILGKTGQVPCPCSTHITVTGNNLVIKGDAVRRMLVCRLDAKCERPDTRKFKLDLATWLPAHRAELVSAGLTVLRAFIVAGRPGIAKLESFGDYDEWSNLVRGALVWLMCDDPCENRENIKLEDPEAGQHQAILTAWEEFIGTGVKTRMTASEVMEAIDKDGTYEQAKELREGFEAVMPPRAGVNAARLGYHLRSIRDRQLYGRCLRGKLNHKGIVAWWVE